MRENEINGNDRRWAAKNRYAWIEFKVDSEDRSRLDSGCVVSLSALSVLLHANDNRYRFVGSFIFAAAAAFAHFRTRLSL